MIFLLIQVSVSLFLIPLQKYPEVAKRTNLLYIYGNAINKHGMGPQVRQNTWTEHSCLCSTHTHNLQEWKQFVHILCTFHGSYPIWFLQFEQLVDFMIDTLTADNPLARKYIMARWLDSNGKPWFCLLWFRIYVYVTCIL